MYNTTLQVLISSLFSTPSTPPLLPTPKPTLLSPTIDPFLRPSLLLPPRSTNLLIRGTRIQWITLLLLQSQLAIIHHPSPTPFPPQTHSNISPQLNSTKEKVLKAYPIPPPRNILLPLRIGHLGIKRRVLIPRTLIIGSGFRVLGCFGVDAVFVLGVFAGES